MMLSLQYKVFIWQRYYGKLRASSYYTFLINLVKLTGVFSLADMGKVKWLYFNLLHAAKNDS